jgi:hypothetical protein
MFYACFRKHAYATLLLLVSDCPTSRRVVIASKSLSLHYSTLNVTGVGNQRRK